MRYAETSESSYGLDDPEVLKVATEIAPELFVALHFAASLPQEVYPINNDKGLEYALHVISGSESGYNDKGIFITENDCRDRFPDGFLPITDRLDLIRKMYLAIVIAHETEARERLAAAKKGEYTLQSSHPFDLKVLP